MNTGGASLISRVSIVTVLTCSGQTAQAHHSAAAHYDATRSVEITGVVVEFRLISPHSVIIVDVPGEDGSVERWEVETSSATNLRRGRGWDENTFTPGDVITVSGSPHRRNIPLMVGSEFITGEGRRPGEARRPQTLEEAYPPSPGAAGISGRWLPPWRGQGSEPDRPPGSPLPLTPAALEAWASYDPELSPVSTCEPMNIPTAFYVGYLFDIRLSDEAILHYELYDVTRTISLDGEPRLADEAGWFGVSAGRMEGDALVIESSEFPPSKWGLGVAVVHPTGNGGDVPSSAQKKVIERYSVSEDGQTLRLDYTVEDPVYLTEPYSNRVEMIRLADEAPMYDFNCDPESALRFTGLSPEGRSRQEQP